MARGSVYKRCPCGTTGTPGKPACRKRHGSWWWRVEAGKDPATGKRRQPAQGGFSTQVEAQDALDDYRHRLATGTVADDHQMTVGAFLTGVFLPLCEARTADGDMSPATLTGYRSHIHGFIVPALGSIRLRDLRRGHVESLLAELGKRQDPEVSRRGQVLAWIAKHPDGVRVAEIRAKFGPSGSSHVNDLRREGILTTPKRGMVVVSASAETVKGVARRAGRGGRQVEQRRPRTVDSVRRTLRAALGVAERRGLIAMNPAQGRIDSIGKIGRADVSWWEPEELLAFLDVAGKDPLSALWTLAAFTGLRRSELCGIRWVDLDLTSSTPGVTVWQRVIAQAGEHTCSVCQGVHRGRLIRANAKTEAGVRWVPLTGESVRELVPHRVGQDAARIPWGDDYTDHGLVFALEDGSPLKPNDVTKRHAELIESAGLRPIRLHDMRHTACSLLLASGTPVEVVAMILGHASPSVTRGIYAHVLRGPATAGMEAAVDLVRHASRAHSVHSIDGSDDRGFGGDGMM
jgi:integrase